MTAHFIRTGNGDILIITDRPAALRGNYRRLPQRRTQTARICYLQQALLLFRLSVAFARVITLRQTDNVLGEPYLDRFDIFSHPYAYATWVVSKYPSSQSPTPRRRRVSHLPIAEFRSRTGVSLSRW